MVPFILSLKQIATTKVSVIIYNSGEFQKEYKKHRECKTERPFEITKSEFMEKYLKMDSFSVPKKLHTGIDSCLNDIDKEAEKFCSHTNLPFANMHRFCWKSNGEIDTISTTISMLQDLIVNPNNNI